MNYNNFEDFQEFINLRQLVWKEVGEEYQQYFLDGVIPQNRIRNLEDKMLEIFRDYSITYQGRLLQHFRVTTDCKITIG